MRNFPHRISYKDQKTIIAEWDSLAELRFEQIKSGKDITFNHILAPNIVTLCKNEKATSVLDVGCGVGILTDIISNVLDIEAVGIDPSANSINIANKHFKRASKFIKASLEEYMKMNKRKFDIVVSNMVLMDVIDAGIFIDLTSSMINRDGVFVFSIIHPFFWPIYAGFFNKNWFEYNSEIIIEDEFRISMHKTSNMISTYVHRPMYMYVDLFNRSGLVLEKLLEPMPSTNIAAMYPNPWEYPRYLIGKCRKKY